MQHEHTVKSFDDELKQLDSMIAEMGGMAEANLAGAVDAMVRRDTESALVIKKADKKIDALEIEIDDHAVRILALRQPMADDLRAVIVALKTASVISPKTSPNALRPCRSVPTSVPRRLSSGWPAWRKT